jgi:hypothetical protein
MGLQVGPSSRVEVVDGRGGHLSHLRDGSRKPGHDVEREGRYNREAGWCDERDAG